MSYLDEYVKELLEFESFYDLSMFGLKRDKNGNILFFACFEQGKEVYKQKDGLTNAELAKWKEITDQFNAKFLEHLKKTESMIDENDENDSWKREIQKFTDRFFVENVC